MMELMNEESNRLATFDSNWPLDSPVLPRDLARAGFFYTGPGDHVQCAYCLGVVNEWKTGHIPMEVHKWYFPWCRYVIGSDVGNVVSANDGVGFAQGFCGSGRGYLRSPKYPNETAPFQSYQTWPGQTQQAPNDLACAGFYYLDRSAHSSICTDEAVFPDYHDLDHRVESFKAIHLAAVNSKQLAAAGFFYESVAYMIRCFYCGMFLRPITWNEQNLFVVHDGESPNCQYICNLQNICQAFCLEVLPDLSKEHLQQLLLQVTEPIAPVTGQNHVADSRSMGAESNQCKICMCMCFGIVFLPCAHLVCCAHCSNLCTECPVCRGPIWARINASLG